MAEPENTAPLEEKAASLTNMIPTSTQITNIPMPTKERGQRSINITDLFITRWTPPWSRPPSLPAYTWRSWVLNQPIAEAAREVLISMIVGLDWKISTRDSDKKKELDATVKYYTKLLEHGGEYLGTDWSGFMEWMLGDLLDIPFGGAAEVGRKGDDEKGRVAWLRPLDGGTLYPTLNADVPVVQYFQGYQAVPFPFYSIARLYFTPRPEIFREGWGMAPPEKIYFAMDMLSRGDKYYANLMLDVPPAGILDLGDMEQSSAEEWVNSFRNYIGGTTDAFRIPVLYEHSNEVKFLPFGKVPNDIMFDHITLKYAALICAAYGIQLNDIGLQTTSRGGDTLAGSIRASTQTHRTGVARVKQKVKFFIEKILPDTLQFDWIDYDDDHNVAMGRARLASVTAYNLLVTQGIFSPEEVRMQLLQEGLMNISVPIEPPPDAKPMMPAPTGGAGGGSAKGVAPKNPGSLGHGVPPSLGGEGKSLAKAAKFDTFVKNIVTAIQPSVLRNIYTLPDDDIILAKSTIDNSLLGESLGVNTILETLISDRPIFGLNTKAIFDDMSVPAEMRKGLDAALKRDLNGLIARGVAQSLSDVLYEMAVKDIDQTSMRAEMGEVTADDMLYDFNEIVDEVKSRVARSLPESLYNYMADDFVHKTITVKSRKQKDTTVIENALVEETPVMTEPKVQPINQVFNFPPMTVNIPERAADIHVHNEAPEVNVQPPDVHVKVNASLPAVPPSPITVTMPAQTQQPPVVNVNVPEPYVHVNVQPSDVPVTVNVPEQPAPTVNVDVQPTPVEINNTVNVPEKENKPKHVEIKKNPDGTWSGKSE